MHTRCHRLALEIHDMLVDLRKIRPVIFMWRRRTDLVVADHLSKAAHGYRVAPALFTAVDSVLNFKLDLFAHENNPFSASDTPSPFALYFTRRRALGTRSHTRYAPRLGCIPRFLSWDRRLTRAVGHELRAY